MSDKENLKKIFNSVKTFVKEVDEVISEELKDNEFIKTFKNKANDIKDKVDSFVEKQFTEEIFAKEVDNTLVLCVVLNGISKDKIDIEIEDNKLVINIDDKDIDKEIKKYWSVSKKKVFYDFTRYEESVIVENTKSNLENGILTITIPRKEKINEKKKIIIN